MVQIRGATLEICNFFPIGFLGGQLKSVTLYVLRAAFCNLAIFSPPAHFLWPIFLYRNFPINSFSLPCHISFSGLQEKLQSGWMKVRGEYWKVEIRLNKCKQSTTVWEQNQENSIFFLFYIICRQGFSLFGIKEIFVKSADHFKFDFS